MGVFGAVKVNRGAPDRESGTVPVVVDVREAPFHTGRRAAAWASTRPGRRGASSASTPTATSSAGCGGYTLHGGGLRLPAAFSSARRRGGFGEEASSSTSTTEFEQPRFLLRDLRAAGLALRGSAASRPAYSFDGARLRTGVIWQPHRSFHLPAYNLERGRYRPAGKILAPTERRPHHITLRLP